jgi:hypothetical protein
VQALQNRIFKKVYKTYKPTGKYLPITLAKLSHLSDTCGLGFSTLISIVPEKVTHLNS